jgi:hypothetical protein
MVKVGDKVRGFKFGEKIGDGSENTFAIEKVTGLNYHPNMDLYVGEEGEVSEVKEETFVVKFMNLRNLSDLLHFQNYDYWTYPIADYLEITRNERLSDLGI